MPSPLRRTHGAHLGNVGHHLMKRPLGRSPKKPVVWHHDFKYQAKTWDQSRRAVAKVEWHRGGLFRGSGSLSPT